MKPKHFYNSLWRLAAIQVTNLLPKNMHKYEGHVQKKNVKQCIYANWGKLIPTSQVWLGICPMEGNGDVPLTFTGQVDFSRCLV